MMMASFRFLLFVALIVSHGPVGAQEYIVFGKGRFMCHGLGVSNMKVQVFEKSYYGFDQMLTEQLTNQDGDFWLSAKFSRDGLLKKTSSLFGFQPTPYLYAEHNCSQTITSHGQTVECVGGAYRNTIPELYVDKVDAKDHNLYDMGTVELQHAGQSDYLGFDAIIDIYDMSQKCKPLQN